jgi:sortase A
MTQNDDSPAHLSKKKVLEPLPGQIGSAVPNPAADLIRQKINALYAHEPDAREEQAEAELVGKHRSKHQAFMHELTTSGKSLAEIQTEWHNYYLALPDQEKHEVWQEFYAEHARLSHRASKPAVHAQTETKPTLPTPEKAKAAKPPAEDSRSISDIKNQLIGRVQTRTKARGHGHFRSLLFGLTMGGVAVLILLFSFFNERIIAPFITPSRSVSNTPIIVDPNSTATGPDPKVIIPKINVEIPVVYDEPSIAEAAIQHALERGVVHYATTPSPGETGNAVIFGHSSNNILNKGKYKFAFVLLGRLVPGDTFMLQKDGKRFVYRVYDKKIVKPSDLSVLTATAKPSTVTLITCDPPGTSLNRLIVVGEQITPDPNANVASTAAQPTTAQPAVLPSNSPSLWKRFTSWLAG